RRGGSIGDVPAMKRGRSTHSKRAMPLSLRVASIYAMLVAATLLVAAGLALQFTRNQLSGQVDSQLKALAMSFQKKVPDGVRTRVASGQTFTAAVVSETVNWLGYSAFFEGQGAIGLVFATGLGLVAVRRTLRPLEDMSHEVESIQETDDLSKRLSGHGPRDEVGRLAEGFDRMLGRLQEAFLSQRRFLSDASHE